MVNTGSSYRRNVDRDRSIDRRSSTGSTRSTPPHAVVKPATVRLRDALLNDPVLDLPQGRETELPDCRPFACAITTGYEYEGSEISTTRRLAAEKIIESLFLDDSVKPRIFTIITLLNACEVCNLKLAVLLRGLVLEFE